jgi:formylglycine-generating enzyme required for sulfatase activity
MALVEDAKKKKDKKFNNLPFIANPEWIGQVSKFVDDRAYKVLLRASHDARFKVFDEADEKKQIDMFQLTFAEYDKYCEINKTEKPSDEGWGRGRRPVINVSWEDAKMYTEWLNQFLGKGVIYALPEEKDWETACNNGKALKNEKPNWHFGDDENQLKDYAWYDENSERKTHPVGEKKPNEIGLYDMYGNVWEWSKNWYNEEKDAKVLRGGSWFDLADYTRSAYRSSFYPSIRNYDVGFRLLRTLP